MEPLLYRGLEILPKSLEDLLKIENKMTTTRLGKICLRHTRWLRVNAISNTAPGLGHVKPSLNLLDHLYTTEQTFLLDSEIDCRQNRKTLFGNTISMSSRKDSFAYPFSTVPADCDTWLPLARLVIKFSNLRDFEFVQGNRPQRFPPGILKLLNRYHRDCRIRLSKFDFHYVDAALIQSPQLYCADIIFDTSLSKRKVRDMLLSAPNLHNVRIQLRPTHKTRGTPWIPQVIDTSRKRASLNLLSIPRQFDELKSEDVYDWNKVVDFAEIRGLQFTPAAVDVLSTLIAVSNKLPRLNRLCLKLPRNWLDSTPRFPPRHGQQDGRILPVLAHTKDFFLDLPPLTELRLLCNPHSDLLPAIYHRHGRTLTHLALICDDYDHVPTQFNAAAITILANSCPLLSTLKLGMYRSDSSFEELACYRALGLLPYLAHLTLFLYSDSSSIPYPQRSSCWSRNYFIPGLLPDAQRTLLNAAIDDAFAECVWCAVCGGDGRPRLRRLELIPSGFKRLAHMMVNGTHIIINNLARTFAVTRGAGGVGFLVQEAGRKKREKKDEVQRMQEQCLRAKWGGDGLIGEAFDIFRILWPEVNKRCRLAGGLEKSALSTQLEPWFSGLVRRPAKSLRHSQTLCHASNTSVPRCPPQFIFR